MHSLRKIGTSSSFAALSAVALEQMGREWLETGTRASLSKVRSDEDVAIQLADPHSELAKTLAKLGWMPPPSITMPVATAIQHCAAQSAAPLAETNIFSRVPADIAGVFSDSFDDSYIFGQSTFPPPGSGNPQLNAEDLAMNLHPSLLHGTIDDTFQTLWPIHWGGDLC